jgi:hypothetical protein
MDQKTIVLYLRMKGMSLDVIHEDLVRTLWVDGRSHPTVTKYGRSAKFSPRKMDSHPNHQSSSRTLSMTLSERLLPSIHSRRYGSFRDGPAFLDPLGTCT